jgi:hypothetical protein
MKCAILDFNRSRRRRPASQLDFDPVGFNPIAQYEVNDLLTALDWRRRRVIKAWMEGHTDKEIVATTGCGVGTTTVCLDRRAAIERLRRELNPEN